jgi:dTDP-4-amino-4,6-dideoxygalactose transaminase
MTSQPQDKPIIPVARPDLPPLDEFLPLLREIWASHRLTNGGPFHQRFEQALAEYLGVPQVSLFANATLALLVAQLALGLRGEVITTPFSFVATAHSLLWNRLRPVFVDIDPVTLCLDPRRVEEAITPQTSAILPVHVYGTPCDTHRLGELAQRHGLRLLYDAAHAFGVDDGGGSLLRHGDASVVSFHATKAFNTFEGGAVVCHDAELKRQIDRMKNFGFAGEVSVVATGINAKMNEFQAALGLMQLGRFGAALERRAAVAARYRQGLSSIAGLRCVARADVARDNHAYFPVLVETDFATDRDGLYEHLKRQGVLARRYFYPLISEFPMYREGALAVHRELADERVEIAPRQHAAGAPSRPTCRWPARSHSASSACRSMPNWRWPMSIASPS